MSDLLLAILQLLGSSLILGLIFLLFAVNKTLYGWWVNRIWSKFFKDKHKFKKDEIEKDNKIREILVELRAITGSDRSCLFQFHNGSVFTTNNPIWKVSNTHESVSPGISSEIGKLQDIKASCLIDTIRTFWKDDGQSGIYVISPEYCRDCPTGCTNGIRKVILINVTELEDGYAKSLLVEQGIHHVIDVPIHNRNGNYIGFVATNYCTERDLEEVKCTARAVCRNAAQIEFVLLN